MQILSGVSTKYGSQLDCVFTKLFICSCDIVLYEAYFHDHKPMLISLKTLVDDSSTMDCQPMISRGNLDKYGDSGSKYSSFVGTSFLDR